MNSSSPETHEIKPEVLDPPEFRMTVAVLQNADQLLRLASRHHLVSYEVSQIGRLAEYLWNRGLEVDHNKIQVFADRQETPSVSRAADREFTRLKNEISGNRAFFLKKVA